MELREERSAPTESRKGDEEEEWPDDFVANGEYLQPVHRSFRGFVT